MGSIQTFGNEIRDLRLRLGLTQLQLAELASVSERTIRSAEKNQRISCSHVSYIAEALGVAAIQIARPPIVSANGHKGPALHRVWEVMLGRLPALSLESHLHRDIQIHNCGHAAGIPQPEQFFRRYAGIQECVLFFELISEYFHSMSPLQVKVTELCRCRSAMALEGTVRGTSASGSPPSLRQISFAILEEGRVQTLVNHIASIGAGDVDTEADPLMDTNSTDLEVHLESWCTSYPIDERCWSG
jgi:transcriptional regulator with XRE-family HTH domain